MNLAPHEKRRSRRKRRTGALLWRFFGKQATEIGTLLETSSNGLAFAWRGAARPKVGALIEMLEDTAGSTANSERAVVRRSSTCHEDLNIIAVEMITTRPFPPSRAEQALAPAETTDLRPTVRPLRLESCPPSVGRHAARRQ